MPTILGIAALVAQPRHSVNLKAPQVLLKIECLKNVALIAILDCAAHPHIPLTFAVECEDNP